MNVMAIFAHPDDMEIQCGGSLALHKMSGDSIKGLILTNGALGGNATERRQEAIVAARLLGFEEIYFLDKEDGCLFHSGEVVREVRDYIVDVNPALIYTHGIFERHQDHVNTHKIVFSAVGARHVGILCGEGVSSLGSYPSVYNDISSVLNIKRKALQAHRSQFLRCGVNLEEVTAINRFRGIQVGVQFAEAFIPHCLTLLSVENSGMRGVSQIVPASIR